MFFRKNNNKFVQTLVSLNSNESQKRSIVNKKTRRNLSNAELAAKKQYYLYRKSYNIFLEKDN